MNQPRWLRAGASVSVLQPSTGDPALIRRAIAGFTAHPADALPASVVWDAVALGAALALAHDGAPLVMLLGDGMDNAGWLEPRHARSALQQAGVPMDLVRLPWSATSVDRFGPGRQSPEDVSSATGGRVYSALHNQFGRDVARRLALLRESYVLTYAPKGVRTGDGWHAIEVRVRGRRVRVRGRTGYHSGGRDAPGGTASRNSGDHDARSTGNDTIK